MLKEKINGQIKIAMKSGDKLRLETLRSIRAAIIEFDKSGIGREMNEEDEIKLLTSLAKRRKDSIEQFSKAGRTDLAEKEKRELEILSEFLPKQLTENEIKEFISGVIKQTGAVDLKDIGKVMGLTMKELKGKADGKLVQELVKSALQKNE